MVHAADKGQHRSGNWTVGVRLRQLGGVAVEFKPAPQPDAPGRGATASTCWLTRPNSGLTCGISQSVDADGRRHQLILIVEATLGTPLLSIAKSM